MTPTVEDYKFSLGNALSKLLGKAYSPDAALQFLWPVTNEVVANSSPASSDELEELLVYRCQQMIKQHDLIQGLTCYYWWPKTRDS
ncbi:MAG: hypothetical protein V7K40_15600 [Nostoc sp.]|uniref:hypothetical protein n=1 Tax=Nostoc sp. TaxID=1180 RepID=UPI002FF86890